MKKDFSQKAKVQFSQLGIARQFFSFFLFGSPIHCRECAVGFFGEEQNWITILTFQGDNLIHGFPHFLADW